MIYWRLEHRWRHHQPHVAFALYCVCAAKDHRWRQNVVRTSVTHTEPRDSFLFLPHLDVICDLLLNRRKATWDRFVKSITTEQQLSYFLLIFLFENKEFCYLSPASKTWYNFGLWNSRNSLCSWLRLFGQYALMLAASELSGQDWLG